MRQRVMKLFLAFMVMTGLFGMRTPVHAGEHAVANWDADTKTLSVTIFGGEYYNANRATLSIVLSQNGVSDQVISAGNETWSAYFPTQADETASDVGISLPWMNGDTPVLAGLFGENGFNGAEDVSVTVKNEDEELDFGYGFKAGSTQEGGSEEPGGDEPTTPIVDYSISIQDDGTIVIGLPDDFTESENKCYNVELSNSDGPVSGFGTNMEITKADGHKYIYLSSNQIPPMDEYTDVDVHFWKVDDGWNQIGDKIYLGHLDKFGPYNISDIAGHAELMTIENTDYLKLWFGEENDVQFEQDINSGKIWFFISIDSEHSFWGYSGELEGETGKQLLIPVSLLEENGFKSQDGAFQISIQLQNTKYNMGSAVFPVIGEDGTVAVETDETGKEVTFTLPKLDDYEVTTADYFKLILTDSEGNQQTVWPYGDKVRQEGNTFFFNMDNASVGEGDDYLAEDNYTVSLEVSRSTDGPLFFKDDGKTHYFAEKGIKKNDDAACTINIADTNNFTITCTGLTEQELDIMHSADQSIYFENNRSIRQLESQPSWGEDGTSVTLTVNEENLQKSISQYIPAGSVPMEFQVNDRDNHFQYPLTVVDGSKMDSLGPIKINIEDLSVTPSSDETYLEIRGDKEILQGLYDNAYKGEAVDPDKDINWQTRVQLRSSDYQKGYHLPNHDDTFCMLEWNDPETKDYLIVVPKILTLHNVEEGDYIVEIECRYANYGTAEFGGPDGIHLKPTEQETITDITAVQQVDDNYSVLITVPEGKEDFLQQLHSIGLSDHEEHDNRSTNPFYTTEDRERSIARDGKKNTVTIDPQKLYFIYSTEPDPAGNIMTLKAYGYKDVKLLFDYVTPLKATDSVPFYQITGDGVVMMTKDKALSEAALEPGADPLFHRANEIRLSPFSDSHDPIVLGNGAHYQGEGMYNVTFRSIQTKRTGVYAVLAPMLYEYLERVGYGNPNMTFYLGQNVHLYRDYDVHSFTYSLAPIYAKYLIEQAESAKELSVEDLQNVDQAALLVNKDNMNNCTVAGTENAATDVANMHVSVDGEIGGAVKNDLSTVFETAPTITVDTEITKFTGNMSEEQIASETGFTDVELTDVQFDINLKKTYAAEGGTKDEPVTELPYGAAVTFDLPKGDTLEEGQSYQLVSQHDGDILTYDVAVENGKGIAYVDKYSSFVLAKAASTEQKPDSKPAPSEDSSKKSSSSDSGKKTAPVKVDNVVTCQMAGYPAGYAWNEAAKACQPGFLDNAGVFHSSVSRRYSVPNTYDKGLKGNIFSLMTSIIVGIGAAWALRKY